MNREFFGEWAYSLDKVRGVLYNGINPRIGNKFLQDQRRISRTEGKVIVAIIGCGCIATGAHIPSYMNNPDVEIKYFCDIIPERAEEAVKKNGCGIAITDYRVALADPEVEAVSVCTPNKAHAFITMDALRAGKHVLCEKPAARTYAEAKAMQDVQHETGKVLNIGVVNRFNTAVNKIRELIRAGVKFYEYKPGFLHAKTFVCDDEIATVGSANMDFRSLYLQFECGVFFCGTNVVDEVRDDFLKTVSVCKEMTEADCRSNAAVRFLQDVFRLLAPLM